MHQEQEIHPTIRFGKTKANLGLQLFYCVQGHHQGDNRRGRVLKVDRAMRHKKVTFQFTYHTHGIITCSFLTYFFKGLFMLF